MVILKDDTESEASFCVADDGSRVDVFSMSLAEKPETTAGKR